MKKPVEVPGVGPGKAYFMFLGEAPGAEEVLRKAPFSGRTNNVLNSFVEALGMLREEVYVTNLIKTKIPGNADPKPEMIKAWAPKLRYEINNVNPTVIFTLGKHATVHMLEEKVRLRDVVGKPVMKRGRLIIPLFHPSYILRFGTQGLLDDMLKILKDVGDLHRSQGDL